jgi:hypothetical protein
MKLVFLACGKHARPIQVHKTRAKCFDCGLKRDVLALDSSDGEYSTMNFCLECLTYFYEGIASKSGFDNDLSDQG